MKILLVILCLFICSCGMLQAVQEGCVSDTVYVPRIIHDTVWVPKIREVHDTVNPYQPPLTLTKDVDGPELELINDSLILKYPSWQKQN